MYTHWRSITQYYYCIRKTRLVKVFFFQFRFQYTQCFIVKFFFYNIIPFSWKYEVTLCIIKICNIMYSKTSFSLIFLAQFMWHTWKKMSCIGNFFFILFHFISSLLSSLTTFMMDHAVTFFWWLGHFVLLLPSPFLSPSMLHFFINDEVKRKERKKKNVWSALIFSPHIICYFISFHMCVM